MIMISPVELSNEGYVPAIYDSDPLIRRSFLRRAAEDGHAPAKFQLALECDDAEEKKQWLQEAAHEGYLPAMYAIGLLCDSPDKRRRWFRMAAQEKLFNAVQSFVLKFKE
jgi:hypothetical protein